MTPARQRPPYTTERAARAVMESWHPAIIN
ncbi:hypothetical protein SBRY_30262 [Actinacidiphila bryophytorum]|uniref:Uncharacterized protein n=1 Tax=Actinacidiphila bryophytorum TaxID=1436133 RepID=A0A9W4H0Q4_9ACTN|nr:hypothetical protein SBRY_30262 [Actinacidiphila bryophytorum]